MSIDIRQLQCAAMAAEMMSFTKAAQKLGIKQSTLSKRVLELERRLGVTLFERTTRGAMPIKTAAEFLATAKRIVGEIDGLQATARAVRRIWQARRGVCYVTIHWQSATDYQ
jgi:DNA-binding transcriptional LysR family regulator